MITSLHETKKLKALSELLSKSQRIVIMGHSAPDGDAAGSSLALQQVLESLDKEVRVIFPDMLPPVLMSLPGAKDATDATRFPEFAAKTIAEADLIICLDFNEPGRVGALSALLLEAKAPKVMIDHHLHPDDFAVVTISRPEMSSTCFLLFKVLCGLELFGYIDKAAAECLLTGMMTDTGNFSYNASDPELHVVVAELMKLGADPQRIYREQFETHSEWCLRLNAYAILKKMEVFAADGAALITLSRKELNSYHYSKGDTEGLVNRPLAIPGVVYSCFMREEDGYVKVSMRSLDTFPVNELCKQYFGGGGHRNAAGGEFKGSLAQAAELFRSLLATNRKLYLSHRK